jgi:ParB-like chromosome segregation protein Spo0J
MNAQPQDEKVLLKTAFAAATIEVSVDHIESLRPLPRAIKATSKWQEIFASIREEGIVEGPVVTPIADRPGYYYVVDGHMRLEAFRDLSGTVVECLVTSTDDTYTFNAQVSRISAVQDHRMILKVIKSGVPIERLSRGLARTPDTIRRRARLLDGICKEVAVMLGDTRCPAAAIEVLKRLKPVRQMDAAELMIASQNFTVPFAKALLAATPDEFLTPAAAKGQRRKDSVAAIARVERELNSLQQKTSTVVDAYGQEMVDLTLLRAHLCVLLGSNAVVKWLARNRPVYLTEFQKVVEIEDVAGP